MALVLTREWGNFEKIKRIIQITIDEQSKHFNWFCRNSNWLGDEKYSHKQSSSCGFREVSENNYLPLLYSSGVELRIWFIEIANKIDILPRWMGTFKVHALCWWIRRVISKSWISFPFLIRHFLRFRNWFRSFSSFFVFSFFFVSSLRSLCLAQMLFIKSLFVIELNVWIHGQKININDDIQQCMTYF